YLYFRNRQHVYSHFWPDAPNPRQIFLPPSPSVIRGASSSPEPWHRGFGPQTIASKIKYKIAATMMAATMAEPSPVSPSSTNAAATATPAAAATTRLEPTPSLISRMTPLLQARDRAVGFKAVKDPLTGKTKQRARGRPR